jgi:hypothetical protein
MLSSACFHGNRKEEGKPEEFLVTAENRSLELRQCVSRAVSV